MSYRIRYASSQPLSTMQKKHHLQIPIAALLLIAAILVLRCVFPEETQRLAEAVIPLSRESTQEALAAFAEDIKAGESFGDAATAFCLEIIHEADLSE